MNSFEERDLSIDTTFNPPLFSLVNTFKIFFLQIGPLPFVGLPPAYGLTVAAVSVAGMGLGAQLVAAFSEAHRYELNVAAVFKARRGTGSSACRRLFRGAQV